VLVKKRKGGMAGERSKLSPLQGGGGDLGKGGRMFHFGKVNAKSVEASGELKLKLQGPWKKKVQPEEGNAGSYYWQAGEGAVTHEREVGADRQGFSKKRGCHQARGRP